MSKKEMSSDGVTTFEIHTNSQDDDPKLDWEEEVVEDEDQDALTALTWEEKWDHLETCENAEEKRAVAESVVAYVRVRMVAPRLEDGDIDDGFFLCKDLLEKVAYECDLSDRLEQISREDIAVVLQDTIERLNALLLISPESHDLCLEFFSLSSVQVLLTIQLEGKEYGLEMLHTSAADLMMMMSASSFTESEVLFVDSLTCISETDSGAALALLGGEIPEFWERLFIRMDPSRIGEHLRKALQFFAPYLGMALPAGDGVSELINGCYSFCKSLLLRPEMPSDVLQDVGKFALDVLAWAYELESDGDHGDGISADLARSMSNLNYDGWRSVTLDAIHRCSMGCISQSQESLCMLERSRLRPDLPLDLKLAYWNLPSISYYMALCLVPLKEELMADFSLYDPAYLCGMIGPFSFQLLCSEEDMPRVVGARMIRVVLENMLSTKCMFEEDEAYLDRHFNVAIKVQGFSYSRLATRIVNASCDIGGKRGKELIDVLNLLLSRFPSPMAKSRFLRSMITEASSYTEINIRSVVWMVDFLRAELVKLANAPWMTLATHIHKSMLCRFLAPRATMMQELELVTASIRMATLLQKQGYEVDEMRRLLELSRTALARFASLAESDRGFAPTEAELQPTLAGEKEQLFHAAGQTLEQSVSAIRLVDTALKDSQTRWNIELPD